MAACCRCRHVLQDPTWRPSRHRTGEFDPGNVAVNPRPYTGDATNDKDGPQRQQEKDSASEKGIEIVAVVTAAGPIDSVTFRARVRLKPFCSAKERLFDRGRISTMANKSTASRNRTVRLLRLHRSSVQDFHTGGLSDIQFEPVPDRMEHIASWNHPSQCSANKSTDPATNPLESDDEALSPLGDQQ